MNKEGKEIKEEIRKEFQLDRMILFSDAVFAIVITLMAIEIRLPHIEGEVTNDMLITQIIHLAPYIIAYAGSFLFIGSTWYQHLQIFSLLKDYDAKLVVRNLVMLFFLGFFPFSASLIATVSYGLYLPIGIYFGVLLACSLSQLRLQHYILVQQPNLRIRGDISNELLRYKTSRIVTYMFVAVFILITITFYLVPQRLSWIAWWWFFPFPFVIKFFKKRIGVVSRKI
jgi:uncharacterized membrane protein